MYAIDPYLIKYDNELHRLFFSLFLHTTFMNIFMNTLTILIFLSTIEYSFGHTSTLIIYLISGIGGNMFAVNY